mmetsp:Transcript_898/g.1920  ORF Transcript_898/g.1920 Transcript_898/m.1920 type:complete len:239 (-) Transcript_898:351-1067(-)
MISAILIAISPFTLPSSISIPIPSTPLATLPLPPMTSITTQWPNPHSTSWETAPTAATSTASPSPPLACSLSYRTEYTDPISSPPSRPSSPSPPLPTTSNPCQIFSITSPKVPTFTSLGVDGAFDHVAVSCDHDPVDVTSSSTLPFSSRSFPFPPCFKYVVVMVTVVVAARTPAMGQSFLTKRRSIADRGGLSGVLQIGMLQLQIWRWLQRQQIKSYQGIGNVSQMGIGSNGEMDGVC